jgi:hypothetical protein
MRVRYQRGYLRLGQRKRGPDRWEFLWWDCEANGVRVRRKSIIGTVQQYPNLENAWQASNGLRVSINVTCNRHSEQAIAVAILIAVQLQKTPAEEHDASLQELRQLIETLRWDIVGTLTQKLRSPAASSLIGPGKLEELSELVKARPRQTWTLFALAGASVIFEKRGVLTRNALDTIIMLRIDLSFRKILDDLQDFLSDQALSLARITWRTI